MPLDRAQYLADALQMTLSCWARSMLLIGDLEERLSDFTPTISGASATILTDFLANAKSANEAAYNVAHALVKDVNLRPLFDQASTSGEDDPSTPHRHLEAILSFEEFSLLVSASFLSAASLHNVLSELADKPDPSMQETFVAYGTELAKYLAGLAKRTLMADEIEELFELTAKLEKARSKLATDEFTLTMQKIALLDQSIATFADAAKTVKQLETTLTTFQSQATSLAERVAKVSA